jgi:hypothetical protein
MQRMMAKVAAAAAPLMCIMIASFPLASSLQPRAATLAYLSTPLIDNHMASSSITAAAAAAASSLFLPSAANRPPLSTSLRPVQTARLISKLHYARGKSSLQMHHL